MPIIAPSMLSSNFLRLEEDIEMINNSEADWFHLDVMDGHFVDNISFGPAMVQAVHETNDIFLDVHLMISRPDHYLPRFLAAGSGSGAGYLSSANGIDLRCGFIDRQPAAAHRGAERQ